MNPIIVTHNDSDGIISAAIVEKYLKSKCADLTYIPGFLWNYGNDTSEISDYIGFNNITDIYMTDITLPDEFMETHAGLIHHFDHHFSSISNNAAWKTRLKENFSKLTISNYLNLDGQQAQQVAACELTWMSLFPGIKMPTVVRLIGRFDVWDNYEKTFGMNEYIKRFESIHHLKWKDPNILALFDDNSDKLKKAISTGVSLYDNLKKFNRDNANALARICQVPTCTGYTNFVIANVGNTNSTFFDSYIESHKDCDIQYSLTFRYDLEHTNWLISCYAVKGNDALTFLKQFMELSTPDIKSHVLSCGGHKNACGAVLDSEGIILFLKLLK